MTAPSRTTLLLQNANFLVSGVAQNLIAFQLDVAGGGHVSAIYILAAAQPPERALAPRQRLLRLRRLRRRRLV